MTPGVLNKWMPDERRLPWIAALIGALLAAWVIFQSHGVINSDGLLYLEAARLFAAGNCCPSELRLPWALYPLLIAAIHQASGLDFQSSAHVLTMFMFSITSAGIVTLIRAVGGDRRVMLAAILLLFATPYFMAKVLPMVVRDHGFWAAHVWSLVFLIRFFRTGTWGNAIAWGAAAILALLFRSEGITYLILLPLGLLLMYDTPWRDRFKSYLKINSLLLMAFGGLLLVLLSNPELSLKKIGGLGEPMRAFMHLIKQLSVGLETKAEIFAQGVLGNYLADYAMPGILLTLTYALLLKVISSAGWIQLGLGIYPLASGASRYSPRYGRFFLWLGFLGLCNAAVLIFSYFLLPKRYLASIATIILIYAAFGLVALWDGWKMKHGYSGRNLLFPAIVVAVFFQLLLILWPSNPKSAYEVMAANWILEHAGTESRLYFDSRRLRYYATGDTSKRKEKKWAEIQRDFSTTSMLQYDYMLVHVSKRKPEMEKYFLRQASTTPLARFDNGRGESVLVFSARR